MEILVITYSVELIVTYRVFVVRSIVLACCQNLCITVDKKRKIVN